jgi:GT2 family glycosyltransferase
VEQAPAERAEIVVVDNLSTDATAAVVRQFCERAPFVRLVRCEEEGANAARNAGVRAARSHRILLCDADDLVGEGWIGALAHALTDDAIVGGTLEVTRLNPEFLIQVRRSSSGPWRRGLPRSIGDIEYLFSGNMGFTRELFDAVGGFDPTFRGGADEVDFCFRAHTAGFSLRFVEDAAVHVRLRADLKGMMRQSYGYAVGNSRLYRTHIASGMLPAQSRRTQLAMFKVYWRRLSSVGNLRERSARWRFAIRLSWIAGSLAAAPRYRVLV